MLPHAFACMFRNSVAALEARSPSIFGGGLSHAGGLRFYKFGEWQFPFKVALRKTSKLIKIAIFGANIVLRASEIVDV